MGARTLGLRQGTGWDTPLSFVLELGPTEAIGAADAYDANLDEPGSVLELGRLIVAVAKALIELVGHFQREGGEIFIGARATLRHLDKE